MSLLWKKNYTVNADIHSFTVGTDWQWDTELVYSDALATIAHLKGLEKIRLLRNEEVQSLSTALQQIPDMQVSLSAADEDCHTWIENYLIARCGPVGKKVHTGRSRNDQVMAATRLYLREMVTVIFYDAVALARLLYEKGREHERVLFPGRTHMQPAMPFTLGLFWQSYVEQLCDDLAQLDTAYILNNRSPLGSAAGYGVPLPLDREYVSQLLGFAGVQNNVLAVQNSRGRVDAAILNAVEQLSITLSRLATDIITYSLSEFGYFSLPEEYCTGSSIMPQKRNPDVLELIRARSVTISAGAQLVRNIPRSLPAGYHRDLQEGKEPLLRSLQTVQGMLHAMYMIIRALVVHPQKLSQAVSGDLLATDRVFQRVQEGMSFRDAYRQVAEEGAQSPIEQPDLFLSRSSSGTPGNPRWDISHAALDQLVAHTDERRRRQSSVKKALFGKDVPLCRLTHHPFFY